jgi:hypothetical protein
MLQQLKIDDFVWLKTRWLKSKEDYFFNLNVGPPKESIFFDYFLWPILHMLQITILFS